MDLARPLKCSVVVDEQDDKLVLRRRSLMMPAGMAAVMTIFLVPWTAGCISMAVQLARQPTLELIFGGTGFGVSWIVLVGVLLWACFGVERLGLGPEGLHYRSSALVTFKERLIPLDEIRGISEHSSTTVTEDGETQTTLGLRLVTWGTPLLFLQGVEARERLWVAERLRDQFQRLLPGKTIPWLKKESFEAERLPLLRSTPEPPSDSAIRLRPAWDQTEFIRSGKLGLAHLAWLGFAAIFWNSILGGFLVALMREFNWFLLVLLVPYGVIGAGLVVGFGAVLLAPFRIERWTIGPSEIAARYSIHGVVRTCRIDVADLGRIDLRKNARSRWWHSLLGWWERQVGCWERQAADRPYTLVLVGKEEQDLLAVDDLTEGEGQWMGCQLRERLRGSLPKPATQDYPPGSADALLWDRELDH